MATNTPNLNLELPAGSDYYNVGVSNANFQKIDDEAGATREALSKKANYVKPENNFVPEIRGATMPGAFTYTSQNGYWTQNGNTVTVALNLYCNNFASAGATGGLSIKLPEGLPTPIVPLSNPIRMSTAFLNDDIIGITMSTSGALTATLKGSALNRALSVSDIGGNNVSIDGSLTYISEQSANAPSS